MSLSRKYKISKYLINVDTVMSISGSKINLKKLDNE